MSEWRGRAESMRGERVGGGRRRTATVGVHAATAAGHSRSGFRLTFLSAGISLVTSFAAAAAPIPLYNIYRAEDGFTNPGISMAIVTYSLGAIVGLLVLGRMSNHLARVYRKFSAGEEVEIEFRSGELLAGTVVWEQEGDVGVVFSQPIDIAQVLASRWSTEASKRRALPRIAVDSGGQLSDGLRSVDVLLRDISQGGASLEIDAQAIGLGKVQLSLPHLPPIAGVVRWTSGATLGVSFNECLAFETLARWIQSRREGLGLVPNGSFKGA